MENGIENEFYGGALVREQKKEALGDYPIGGDEFRLDFKAEQLKENVARFENKRYECIVALHAR